VLYALVIGFVVMSLTGAIARWGQWYAEQPYYRAQVHALFEGRLALTHAPEGLALDLAWVDGGVQQVWGLGVPIWMSIWEVIGRAIHLSPFPDRLAMLFGVVLTFYALLRAWLGPGGDRSFASLGAFVVTALLPGVVTMLRGRVDVYEEAAAYTYGAAMLLLAGVVMMVRRPSTARYVLLLAFAGATGLLRPTLWFYGAATAVVATALYVRHRGSLRGALGSVALAAALFLAGGGALYATNAVRFGSGDEFGHRLNLEDMPGNMYATRFDYPFATVATSTAAKELIGAMFGRPEQSLHRQYYDAGIHVWQANRPRLREYYFTTYTWATVPLVALGLAVGTVAWRRARKARRAIAPAGPALDRDTRWLTVWAVLGGVPLVVFYLHSPSTSSRYFLDFAPSVAVLLVTVWRYAATVLGRRGLGGVAFAALMVWWVVSMADYRTRRSYVAPQGKTSADAAMRKVTDPPVGARLVPEAYDIADPWLALYLGGDRWVCRCFADAAREQRCDHAPYAGAPVGPDVALVRGDRERVIERVIERVTERGGDPGPAPAASGSVDAAVDAGRCTRDDRPAICAFDDPAPSPSPSPSPSPAPSLGAVSETRIAPPALYGNGTGWDLTTGAVGVSTYLFVDDPQYVEVEVTTARGSPPVVRAKIQLEELALEAVASTPRGVRLRFAGPRTARYRRGLQVVFLAFGPPDRLDQPVSEYSLLRVAWRHHREGS